MAPLTDEEWADVVAHELPKPSDPVIQKYLESRQALMAEEQKQRSDYLFRQAMSPIAKKACDIVAQIRDEERRTSSRGPREASKTWQIIRRLPKGTLLGGSCHSLVDINRLVDVAMTTPGMCISCNMRLIPAENTREARVSIQFKSSADSECGSLWADTYTPGTFVPLASAADNYPEGGRDGFLGWLKGQCVVPEREAGINNVQDARSVSSEIINGMLYYEPIWRTFLRQTMANLAEDGVCWLELRLGFPLAYYPQESDTPDQDQDNLFQAIEEELAAFQATDAGREFWGLRIIWSTARSRDSRSMVEDADSCVAAKLLWPDLVAGYDLAGPLADRLPELFWFRKQCALEGVQIPFSMRASGDGTTADDNLFDALLLGTRRIDNALSLHRHPRLIEAIKDKRILAQTSPASHDHDAAGTTTAHIARDALPTLLTQGVPCALSCDDGPGTLSGQDHDAGWTMTSTFWQALHAWDGIDLATLGSLAENSVRWAIFEDQDADTWARDIRAASVGAGVKAARLQQWAVEWERFCLWVVTEYGDTVRAAPVTTATARGDDDDDAAGRQECSRRQG